MYRVIYLGNSEKVLNCILNSTEYKLVLWICETRKKDSLVQYANMNDIDLLSVSTSSELVNILSVTYDVDFAIMFSFGIILKEQIINKCDVFNFHPGNLASNRGRNPIEWALLLGWDNDDMSLYKVTSECIDCGVLVSKCSVSIYENDTANTMADKMISCIPKMLIDLDEYQKGTLKGVPICSGIYRTKITEKDYTIDLFQDSEYVIKNKIRSQADYNGAVIVNDGEKKYIKSFSEFKDFVDMQGFHPQRGLILEKTSDEMKI